MQKLIFLVFFPFLYAFGQLEENQTLIRFYSDSQAIDQAYLRQKIKFVHYVRERLEADVHLLVSVQNTGGQGKAYTLTFVGQNRFSGVHDTLSFVAENSESPTHSAHCITTLSTPVSAIGGNCLSDLTYL